MGFAVTVTTAAEDVVEAGLDAGGKRSKSSFSVFPRPGF